MKFNSKKTAPQNAYSPLAHAETHIGTDKIRVKLIDYPDEQRFKKALSKMVKATIGSDPDEEIPDEVGEELFKGGLQTGLEAAVLTFEVSGISRTCTHQIVRTRKAAYHQQSSRYTNMGVFNVRMPSTISNNPQAKLIFEQAVEACRLAYSEIVDLDIPFQDARFVCPEAIETYIICEFPLRTFLDLYAYRSCPMFQWEIVHVMELMKQEIAEKLPWLVPYIITSCEKTKKCMFQGWESTDDCDKPWAGNRIFESKTQTSTIKPKKASLSVATKQPQILCYICGQPLDIAVARSGDDNRPCHSECFLIPDDKPKKKVPHCTCPNVLSGMRGCGYLVRDREECFHVDKKEAP